MFFYTFIAAQKLWKMHVIYLLSGKLTLQRITVFVDFLFGKWMHLCKAHIGFSLRIYDLLTVFSSLADISLLFYLIFHHFVVVAAVSGGLLCM